MRREATAIGLAMILAGPYACLAQQAGYGEGGRDGAAPTQVSAIPLTPDMIKALGKRLGDNRRAQEEVTTQFAAPNSRRVNVSFTPGQTTNIIQLVKGYPTAVSFFDLTGEPWPIEWDTNSNPAGVAGGANCSSNPSAGGPAVAAVGFYVCTPVKGSNVLEITPMSLQPRGGLLVTLQGAPKPISFLLVGGGGRYDADLSVQVADRGPHAKPGVVQALAPDTAAPFLTAMLDGAPPADATPLSVSGVSPDELRAWKMGDRVYLRTRLTLVSPEWVASENGEGGLTVYAVPSTPVVLLSAHGRTVSASLTEN
ncbi:DotH/IcmK family type IV secretion protein (plasmid) [Methylocapsa polymorpha]|uniref:DotH/IcmK family type IV secretion protein n=1 Tax=Methylocapsa polymorpha TaxID=3080828 RepID=A0ABZ0HZM7_9HYPH|nr:DotH/IcmK family type IV secretion protein [Methylocapsa sp. RX1]WOJ91785.1 DotH/IcmK family type IV secretion protein [Methylocapsa sp. RX1]